MKSDREDQLDIIKFNNILKTKLSMNELGTKEVLVKHASLLRFSP